MTSVNEQDDYLELREELTELKAVDDDAKFDYEDKKGNKAARSHLRKFSAINGQVEAIRKEKKAFYLEGGRKVDATAKEIKADIAKRVAKHKAPLEAIEQRIKEQLDAINLRIEEMRELGSDVSNMDYTAEALKARRVTLWEDYPLDDSFGDSISEATSVKEQGINSLDAQIERRLAYEKEQAELEKLRKEAAEREAKEREERIAAEAAEKAKQEAEDEAKRLREAAEQAQRAEREAAERRELELKLKAEQAEKARINAENQARLAEENAKRKAKEAEEKKAAEAAARKANEDHRRKINCEAKAALVAISLSDELAQQVVTMIAKGEIPHVAIAY